MINDTHVESLIEENDIPVKRNVKEDRHNIIVLFVLYTLQGVPLGLSLAIPIFMHNIHNSTFKEQAKFSLAVWPFSIKLLWAPLVDSLFLRKFGRRKSWLIPVQYSLGIFFFVTGFYINEWLVKTTNLQINALTSMFFILNFLAATQDIVVDGWALTMLNKKNLSYAAVCNGAGQAFGIFLGNVLSIVLVSEKCWNSYWRTNTLPHGIITLQDFFYLWGTIFIIFTTLLAIFKTEKYIHKPDDVNLGIIKTYKLLFNILKLHSIKKLAIILLTIKISFCSIDAAFKLKLISGGITKDQIAAIESLIVPFRICLPFIISRFTSKEKPLIYYFNTIPYRLLIGVLFAIIIYLTPYFLVQTGLLLIVYKIVLVLMNILREFVMCVMMLMAMSFYAGVSDPKIGGTNMTLLSTIGNIGMVWSQSGALWLIDVLTFKQCSNNHSNSCWTQHDQIVCVSSNGTCQVIIDGFYIEAFLCTIYGMIWYCIFKKSIYKLQSKNIKEWHVKTKELRKKVELL